MKKTLLLLLIFSLSLRPVLAQEKVHEQVKYKHWFNFDDNYNLQRIWMSWGYNRAWFSTSDLHFKGPGYNFMVADVVAKDRPAPFNFKLYFNPNTSSIPQYNWHIGYFIKKHIYISGGMDHMKYVMVPNQIAKVTGTIDASKSLTYQGTYAATDMKITPDFLRFEHTNGLNLASIDAAYLLPIYKTKQDIIRISANIGGGLGLLICKTDVKVLDYGLDNKFHLSGFSMHAAAGLRVDIWKYMFIASEWKGGYINLPDVLIHNNRTDLAHHHFGFAQYQITAGLSLGIWNLHPHKES